MAWPGLIIILIVVVVIYLEDIENHQREEIVIAVKTHNNTVEPADEKTHQMSPHFPLGIFNFNENSNEEYEVLCLFKATVDYDLLCFPVIKIGLGCWLVVVVVVGVISWQGRDTHRFRNNSDE